MPEGAPPPPGLSVVVPAHQEEGSIDRCLTGLAELAGSGEAEVVVVVNGSTDATAQRARRYPGVRVLETPEASKAAALNLGDGAVEAFPRVYLDADVAVEPAGLRALADLLRTDEPRVGGLRLVVDLRGCSLLVRGFYAVFLRMAYAEQQLVGLGIYALSAAGRARFDAFPSITADDLYVDRLFAPDERVVLEDHSFTVQAPRRLADLLAVRTRVHYGNAELARHGSRDERFATSTGQSLRTLLDLVRRTPRLLPAALVYVGVTVEARRRAAARQRTGQLTWERDRSTR